MRSAPSRRLERRRSRPGPLDRPRPLLGGKSIWAWLHLLAKIAVPLVVVLATVGFGWWQAHLADLQHRSDQQRALEQQQASILQTYIDNMQDLLINHDLGRAKATDEIGQVAKEQTLATLRRLDASHNRIVLRFLQQTHLIGARDAVIDLSYADLSGDDLRGAYLSGINMVRATLADANLSGADLTGAALYGADLSGTHLHGAQLSDATLTGADLTHADLTGARLSSASLGGAFLGAAVLDHAALTGAHLDGATLTGAALKGANLSDATLNGADLSHADLSGADLSDADLSGGPDLTQPQLDEVRSCTNAILSAGLTCHHHTKIRLTYWFTESPAEVPVIGTLIKQFEHANPDIAIAAVHKPYFQTQAAFITASRTGKAPDILRSDVGWVAQLASEHYLLNIDSYTPQHDLSDYLKAPLGYDEYGGHLYGLPQVTDFLALLYNKADLASAGIAGPPATMAGFEADAERIVRGRHQAAYGFETNGMSYFALPFLWAFGGGMLGPHEDILVNDPGSVAGLKFVLKLQNADKVMPQAPVQYGPRVAAEPSNMLNDFMSGRTAMIFDGPWDVSQILTGSAFAGRPGNLGIVGIPTGPDGRTGSPRGGQSYVISDGTAHPLEAYKFISFMSSTPSQVAIAKANHTLPTRWSAYRYAAAGNPVVSEFVSIDGTAVTRPAIPQGGHLFDAFDPAVGAALDGAESPADALNVVAAAWRQLLSG